ncbi:50S ribosomal protein L25 [Patescibacteria group bacterium]|nr:50S ribosomal protein L25 [Patescibacteria group bacterium]
MKKIQLKAEKRDIFRKKLKEARKRGQIPAVMYGSEQENTSLFVQRVDFEKAWRKAGESVVIELEIGKEKAQVVINDVALDPLTHKPQHVDFYAVDLKKKITASVPLVFIGESSAVKNLGGVLVKVIHDIEVEGLPESLPKEIEVDISALETFEDKVMVKDLKLSEGINVAIDGEDAVALVEKPREEEIKEEPGEIDMSAIEATGEKGEKEKEGDEAKDEKEEKSKDSE